MLGKMQYVPAATKEQLGTAVSRCCGQLRGQALSNVLWSMARLHECSPWDGQLQQALLKQVLVGLWPAVGKMGP